MLRQQEPYPALVLDRHWNVLKVNEGSARVQRCSSTPRRWPRWARPTPCADVPPEGVPTVDRELEPTAASLIQWLHRDVATGFADAETRALLEESSRIRTRRRQWRSLDLDASPAPFLPIEFRKGDLVLRYFTTLTTLGTPHDITLQELRIESFFPADEATEHASCRLSA